MLIGLGGGAASSLASGSGEEQLDFASVQRGNPEMQRRCQEVINRCWQQGESNPIVSIHDVGAGGLFLATEAHLSIDTWLNLQIELPDGESSVCCRGRVAWLNHPDWIKKPQLPHGMGVEFIDITDDQQQRIARHLSQA